VTKVVCEMEGCKFNKRNSECDNDEITLTFTEINGTECLICQDFEWPEEVITAYENPTNGKRNIR
jgi:hypothetical protein